MSTENLALLTDFYELTMMGGYFECGKLEQRAVFDLYFRRVPQEGAFCVAAGLEPALDYLVNLRFTPDDLAYLRAQNLFSDGFLEWLKSFRFRGDVYALPEGTLVFPGQPLLRVEASLPEAQLIESLLLNVINFQTLIATKAARVYEASGEGTVLEFGLRRAQGVDGAMSASRAAYIGGCQATSNTLAGQRYGIPTRGTMAHSWVMSFPSELEAFRAYARAYPGDCTLLVDTYDTLESGIPNAIRVGHEMRAEGLALKGIRLDSGDLAYLSKQSRKLLDQAGLSEVKIVASSDLDEFIISDLRSQGARIDIWGVGTNLVTSKGEPALGGVYKLVAAEEHGRMVPRIKVSSNPAKITLPGIKQIYRGVAADGTLLGDVLALAEERFPADGPVKSGHPLYAHVLRDIQAERWEPLLGPVLKGGERVYRSPELAHIRQRTLASLASLRAEHKRQVNPDLYWAGISNALYDLRKDLLGRALV
ncbi:MAG: nicotinate phosphoribosyltransferase [Candidatus Eremiobacterota bacterium]